MPPVAIITNNIAPDTARLRRLPPHRSRSLPESHPDFGSEHPVAVPHADFWDRFRAEAIPVRGHRRQSGEFQREGPLVTALASFVHQQSAAPVLRAYSAIRL